MSCNFLLWSFFNPVIFLTHIVLNLYVYFKDYHASHISPMLPEAMHVQYTHVLLFTWTSPCGSSSSFSSHSINWLPRFPFQHYITEHHSTPGYDINPSRRQSGPSIPSLIPLRSLPRRLKFRTTCIPSLTQRPASLSTSLPLHLHVLSMIFNLFPIQTRRSI